MTVLVYLRSKNLNVPLLSFVALFKNNKPKWYTALNDNPLLADKDMECEGFQHVWWRPTLPFYNILEQLENSQKDLILQIETTHENNNIEHYVLKWLFYFFLLIFIN